MKGWLKRWGLYRLIPAVILLLALLFSMLGAQMYREVAALRSAPQDNVQWTLAQVEIELLTLLDTLRAAQDAGKADPRRLAELRKRFDIFYSRNRTIARSQGFQDLRTIEQFSTALGAVRQTLDDQLPLIDGDDPALFAGLPDLEEQFQAIRPTTRQLSLIGIRKFAELSDKRRHDFGLLVFQTAGVGLVLIVALIFALAVLYRQRQIAQASSAKVRESRSRFANTVNVSLDAIIVADGDGTILDFNPAAEKTFGYSHARAVGADMADLIVPPTLHAAHKEGMRRYLRSGKSKLVGKGRFELDAMHANGSIFPVEMSIGAAAGENGEPIFIAYVRDISKRKRIEVELTNARDKALAADKAKSQFLAVMSHEMRTPLNAVMATLDLLDRTELKPRQRDFLQTAITSGEILQHHIDDVLDLTRIEAGAIDLQAERFDIRDLIAEVERSTQLAADKKGDAVSVQIDLDETQICLDRNRLRQILLNLVSNAIKFTDDGTIDIIAASHADTDDRRVLTFEVKDTGIGIAPEDLGRIFGDFVTLDPSYQRKAEGYGLGLAICRRIAAAMGGKITVRSERGVGSSFLVTLPEAEETQTTEERRPESTSAAVPSGASLRVLMVEDNETNRFVARAMLEEEGCTVVEAVDGKDGVAKAQEERFDLILMDISMPRLDGIEAARMIRSGSGASKAVPIVCLTAHAMSETRDALHEAGVTDCLIKPLRRKNLQHVLSMVLKHDRAQEHDGDPETDILIDPVLLNELATLMPPERLNRSFGRFIEEVRSLRAQFETLCESRDSQAVLKHAHHLTGSSGMFGAVALTEAFRHFQDLAAAGDMASILELLDDVDALGQETIAAFETEGWAARRPVPTEAS